MPRKRSEVPPALRIRENQRRSRVRKKELIEELQSRLQDYENDKTEATILIQQAARRVVWENVQLRNLLAEIGVDGQQIADFLQSQQRGDTRPALITSDTGPRSFLLPINGNADLKHKTASYHRSLSPIQLPTPPSSSEFEAVSTVQHYSTSIRPNHHTAVISELSQQSNLKDSNVDDDCGTAYPLLSSVGLDESQIPSVSDCFCPEIMQDQSVPEDMGTMSCETAASIIASMRGHDDEELVMRELGCEKDSQCQIENMRVFQVMESD